MNPAREIAQMDEVQCIKALSEIAQAGTTMGIGIAGRLQQLQLAKLSNTAELTNQTAKLVAIAEAQRVLAAKLDGQTDTLIGLTRTLKALTVWLLILTVLLCALEAFHFFESRKNPIQVAPRRQQTSEHPL